MDEIAEAPDFGTHRLILRKPRHLGPEVERALQPVRLPDNTLRDNFICLDIKGFNVEEKGDLHDLLYYMSDDAIAIRSANADDDLPPGLR